MSVYMEAPDDATPELTRGGCDSSSGEELEENSSVYSCSSNRTVQVAVRVRPLLGSSEKEACLETLFEQKNLNLHAKNNKAFRKHPSILRIAGGGTSNSNNNPKASKHNTIDNGGQTFCYDEVFPETATQAGIFQHRVEPLVQRCLDGYNASVLAYGQTSSGVSTHK